MRLATEQEELQIIKAIAQAISRVHHNHVHRNERLTALRTMIDYFYRGNQWKPLNDHHHILRTCEHLAIWQMDHETHSDVRTRLRLIQEVCDMALREIERKEEEERQERQRHNLMPFAAAIEDIPMDEDSAPPSAGESEDQP